MKEAVTEASRSAEVGDLSEVGVTETVSYQLRVNGAAHNVTEGWLGESLLHVLRERLGLPGSKSACEQGECGSCSVLVDGVLVCSCLVLAASAVGRNVVTVEALAGGEGQLSAVQQAFVDEGAVQCGFCTPGLVMAVHDLLARTSDPTDLDVREAISGNLCRCTGYGRIFSAVRRACMDRGTGETAVGLGDFGTDQLRQREVEDG